jgi:hypothetical protein
MKQILHFLFAIVLTITITSLAMAGEKKKMKGESPIKSMSKEQLIKLAESAAPAGISKDATIMVPGEDGKLMEARKGTNGFTCIPDVDGLSKPDPICFDQPTGQWVNDLMSGAPKPTNTAPGISYMAQGGWHFEKDGMILMKNEPGAKTMREPPHWMVVWPFDSKATGLPSMPAKHGTYVMWDGTPYAHLMIHQDPNKMGMMK